MEEQDAQNLGINLQHKVQMFKTVQMAFDHPRLFIRDACFFNWRKYTQTSKIFFKSAILFTLDR